MIAAEGDEVVYRMTPKRARQVARALELGSNARLHAKQLRDAADQVEANQASS